MKPNTLSPLAKWSLAAIPALGMLTLATPARAVTWTTLDDPDATINGTPDTHASGISGSNVVGYYNFDSPTSPYTSHGFFYDGSTYTVQDGPSLNSIQNGGTAPIAHGISGSNIVGWYADSSTGTLRGYLYNGSSYTLLDATFYTAHPTTLATGIDGSNVVGYFRGSGYDPDQSFYGFLDQGGTYTLINDPLAVDSQGGHMNCYAYGISGSNVVGSFQDGNTNFHGFLYNGSTYTTLDDPLGTRGTWARGIDGTNIVGYYADSNFKYHGFLYDGSTYTTLDDPSVDGGGSTLALGISGSNIVGYYSNHLGEHGFIASNVPEPASAALLGLGTLGLLARRRSARA